MSDGGIIIPEAISSMCDDDLVDDIAEIEDDNIAVDEHQVRPSENSLIESLPSMVSITRVPKPKPPEAGTAQVNNIMMGKTGGSGGPPPPLLRLGNSPTGLPPMPRLKLGGVRPQGMVGVAGPASLASNQSINGIMNLIQANRMAYPQSSIVRTSMPSSNIKTTTTVTINVPAHHTEPTMPIIAGTVSLHKAVTSSPGILQQKLQGLPINHQRAQQQGLSPNAIAVAKNQQQQLAMQQQLAAARLTPQQQQALLRRRQAVRQMAAQQGVGNKLAAIRPAVSAAQQVAAIKQAAHQQASAKQAAQQQTAAKQAAQQHAAAKQAAYNKQQLMAAQQLAAQHRLMKQKAAAAAVVNGAVRQQMMNTNRPVQVRTVFVPPPMNNMHQPATSKAITVSNQVVRPSGTANIRSAVNSTSQAVRSSIVTTSQTASIPKTVTSFPLNIPNPASSGITITPLSNGKSNDSNGGNVSKESAEYEYEDIEIDDDDELLDDDDDDEYNEITEAPSSLLTIKNLMPDSAPQVSGSVTLHRLLNKKPEDVPKPTITVPVPLPVHLQPKPLHLLKADSMSNQVEQPVSGASSMSRRNSGESIASVASTAASNDSSSGQPKARKSFKPGSRTSSPAAPSSGQTTNTINNNKSFNSNSSISAHGNGISSRLGSLDSNISDPDSLKRDRDSIEYDPMDRSSVSKKLKSGGGSGFEQQMFNQSSFGTHFLSSLLPGGQNKPGLVLKSSQSMLKPRDSCDMKSLDDSLMLASLCTCEAECIPVPGKEGTTCQGVEVFGGYRVGCKNRVTRGELVKTSVDSEPVTLCDMHRDRLQSHACCPLCGEFCSHGLVFMCRVERNSSPHLFHRFCYQLKSKDSRRCPHCSSSRPPLAVQLKLSMSRTPLKILNQTAKMTPFKRKQDKDNALERWEVEKRRESTVIYTLPNGKVISGTGLPNGLEVEKLTHVVQEVKAKSQTKQITRNMYQPTQDGDNVKLLQLLALDYSPRQKFTEANGGSPLHVSAMNNHVLTTHILVQAGAEVNALDDKNETPLMIAAIRGYADIIRYLLVAGSDLSLAGDDGMTALHYATQNGHVECAHVLLSHNKLPRNFINVKDDGGWTPLVWACEHKHEGVIRYLLEQGADPHVMDVEMNISLHWAAFSGSKNITDMLISSGCNVNQANAIGETPIHIALRQDHYECALLLLARGARLDLPNSQGQLPSSCMNGENPKIESLINLGTTLHKLMKDRQQKFLSEKTVKQDISSGKENLPITAVNGEDFEMGPSGYTYVRNPVVTGNIPINRDISSLQHCKCTNDCISEDICKCADNSTRSWYDKNGILKEGFDFNDPPMVFECNEMCDCNQNSCNNRVVQHGITARMQVYKTYGMGWGAKSMVDIPKGGFVCEYVGEIISDAQAEQRENDSYLFDLENREGDTFCLDANKFGNVARFINHSCNPNLIPVKVFTSHQDLRFPHIAFFASKPIKKGDVLGFDYGEKFWVIKHKSFTCWCGAEKCKYSKWTIGKTLENYYKNLEETNKSKTEEPKPQTGKLKLKLRMEEGKVVKVDDSGLLPDEPHAKKKEERGRKSPDDSKKTESKKLESKKSPKDDSILSEGNKKHELRKLEAKKSPEDNNEKASYIHSNKGLEAKKSPRDDNVKASYIHSNKGLEAKKSPKDDREKASYIHSNKGLEAKNSPKDDKEKASYIHSNKGLEAKKSPKDDKEKAPYIHSNKGLEAKKSPKDLDSVSVDSLKICFEKNTKEDVLKGQEDKVLKLEAQLRDDRKSPVIKINKSAIAEYHKAKETKKALKQAAREERKQRSKSSTPEPVVEPAVAVNNHDKMEFDDSELKNKSVSSDNISKEEIQDAIAKPEDVNDAKENTEEKAEEILEDESMDIAEDNDAITEHILEPMQEVEEAVEDEPSKQQDNNSISHISIYETTISQDVEDSFFSEANKSIDETPKEAVNNPQQSKDVVKAEEIVTPQPRGRVLRQARKTIEKPQQANSKTKSTEHAPSNAESDLKSKVPTVTTNGQATPSIDNSASTKPVQTVNVSVAEEMATITESSHAESKVSDEATDSPAEDSIVTARRGRPRTTRRSAASAAASPAASKNGLAATTRAAKTPVASPAQAATKVLAASASTAAKSASAAVKGTAGKKDSRPSTPLTSERPKRTRKSLAESREAS